MGRVSKQHGPVSRAGWIIHVPPQNFIELGLPLPLTCPWVLSSSLAQLLAEIQGMHPRVTEVSDFLLSFVWICFFLFVQMCNLSPVLFPGLKCGLDFSLSVVPRTNPSPMVGGTEPSGVSDSSPGPKLGRWSQDHLLAFSIFLTGDKSPLISGPWCSPSVRWGKSFPLTDEGLKVLALCSAHERHRYMSFLILFLPPF